jgi:hypothetical protein
MPKIEYVETNFSTRTREVIDTANDIIREYLTQGFSLTLRQLYYQFVARGYLPNTDQSYKRLGSIVSDGRRGGLIDWLAIEDRTRYLRELGHWNSPEDIIGSVHESYRLDLWVTQPVRPEVWIEKDALVGVIDDACTDYDVPFFSCRGYVSDSEIWRAAQRVLHNTRKAQKTVILHLGDHDPSGIDMTRDIEARLTLFTYNGDFEIRRLALNMDQVELYNPPPNPAKMTDSRFSGYIAEYGGDSWELDALEPQVIAGLIRDEIVLLRDVDAWVEQEMKQEADQDVLRWISENWDEVAELAENG